MAHRCNFWKDGKTLAFPPLYERDGYNFEGKELWNCDLFKGIADKLSDD